MPHRIVFVMASLGMEMMD